MQTVTIELRKKGAWSRMHDFCICCGTSNRKHISKGLCGACYARAYRDVVKVRKEIEIRKVDEK